MAEKKIRMTAKGFQDLQERLDLLQNDRRAEVAKKLEEARSQGDLSENAEYDAAKDAQAELEAEIAELKKKIELADIISDGELSNDEIGIGSYVSLKDLEFGDELHLQIVGSVEAKPFDNMFSDESPLGAAAVHKKVGDVFEYETPAGMVRMEVLSITRGDNPWPDEVGSTEGEKTDE
ncbi:MAG: transcription elongation factor GreA [Oscillospiraceae bacterium]|nr:transcription elongation factor GreA [Oscillospiraceae bacterium]